MNISEKEYENIISRISYFEQSRQEVLRFLFGLIIAELISAFIHLPTDKYSIFLFLIPFLIIIPFTARLAYYRSCVAHLSAFLFVFAKENRMEYIARQEVPDKYQKTYPLISWLVKFEPFVLSLVCVIVYYIKLISFLDTAKTLSLVMIVQYSVLPIICCITVYIIILYSSNYKKMSTFYIKKYQEYYDHNHRVPTIHSVL